MPRVSRILVGSTLTILSCSSASTACSFRNSKSMAFARDLVLVAWSLRFKSIISLERELKFFASSSEVCLSCRRLSTSLSLDSSKIGITFVMTIPTP